jgi:hypothetical protein
MESRRKREADLIVIGRGLAAVMTGFLASEAGMRVVQYRTGGRYSLYDHCWLHSGLLLDTDSPTARLIRVWGRNMLRRFGIRASSEAGIVFTRTEETARGIQLSATSLALNVSELSASDAARIARPLPPAKSYAVPDATFDQGALTGVVQGCYMGARTSVIDLARDESIKLLPCDAAAGGFLVQTAEEVAEGAVTVLADGAMIPALIEPLGIRHPLAVSRSPVVSIQEPGDRRPALLVDLDRGLSYVRHGFSGASSAVYTIAHTDVPERLNCERPVPDLLQAEILPASGQRAKKVGVLQMVETGQVDGKPPIMPWIREFKPEGFPGLVAVVNNIANLALWAATQVMKLADPSRSNEGPALGDRSEVTGRVLQ